eukprot:747219-Hanusia_phi.AAC.3
MGSDNRDKVDYLSKSSLPLQQWELTHAQVLPRHVSSDDLERSGIPVPRWETAVGTSVCDEPAEGTHPNWQEIILLFVYIVVEVSH